MAEPIKATLDTSQWDEMLNRLDGPLKVSLARSMAVAGGKVLRDEAKRYAPVETGALRDSIYLAYKEGKTTENVITYSVSWNSKLAPHGHLLEFGHWLVRGGKTGKGGERIGYVEARPFLRPALDSGGKRAQQAMVARGRERLPELLNGGGDEPGE